jgi:hypothetical protein
VQDGQSALARTERSEVVTDVATPLILKPCMSLHVAVFTACGGGLCCAYVTEFLSAMTKVDGASDTNLQPLGPRGLQAVE